MAKRPSDPAVFLHAAEKKQIEEAVAAAEQSTSAEIKVIVVRHCWDNIKRKAAAIFRKHRLDQTAQRNCVLILLVTTNREFLIYGDEGIHQKVGQDFWNGMRDTMIDRFKQDRFGDGLADTVRSVGEKLAAFFPHQANDRDEVSNEVISDE